MIFLINFEANPEVIVYQSLKDLSNRVEWQDIFEGKDIILDDKGNQYKWDSSKREEIGTVYDYTLIEFGKNAELAKRCNETFAAGSPQEFDLKLSQDEIYINVNKNQRIRSLVNHLTQTFGDSTFKIRDNWDGDLEAIGFVDNTETYLVYVSTFDNEQTFYVALENPPIDTEQYKPVGDFDNLNLDELEQAFAEHLRIEKRSTTKDK